MAQIGEIFGLRINVHSLVPHNILNLISSIKTEPLSWYQCEDFIEYKSADQEEPIIMLMRI